ncbi:hypothetical protein RC74_14415 [Falsihalocynthiibacter arcticus]|uniref:Transposase IS110-like N-terminal domain-containing protein n=1 Tax=Falsihalocynthiibacter arcticus TaxID=1579316 RepID=A0A126V2B5_9RHOB|nr:hypothetical protein RC74_14415 [Falsihalocynthiibacter arcticus]
MNPLQARRFAQAQGLRAKTDTVDAKMLAVMGDVFALEPDNPAAKIQHYLKELRAFRAGLIKDRTGIICRLKTQTLSITRRQSKARLAQVDKEIREINAEVDRLISSRDMLAHSVKIPRSIPGIGASCASTILIEMPEIGSEAGGQLDWSGPNDASIWTVARQIIHSGWSKNSEGCPLHAGLVGDATQPRLQG